MPFTICPDTTSPTAHQNTEFRLEPRLLPQRQAHPRNAKFSEVTRRGEPTRAKNICSVRASPYITL